MLFCPECGGILTKFEKEKDKKGKKKKKGKVFAICEQGHRIPLTRSFIKQQSKVRLENKAKRFFLL